MTGLVSRRPHERPGCDAHDIVDLGLLDALKLYRDAGLVPRRAREAARHCMFGEREDIRGLG